MPLYGLVGCGSYTFSNGGATGYNVLDATAFYLSMTAVPASNPVTTAPTGAGATIPIVRAGTTITDIYLTILDTGTLGSGEFGSLAILVNNTTATTPAALSGTLQWSSIVQSYSATGLSIVLAAGDFFTVRITPPNFATNPTSTFYAVQVVYTNP